MIKFVTSAQEESSEHYDCSLCSQIYVDPRLLVCCHNSICTPCLSSLKKAECPWCRATIDLETTPVNKALAAIVESRCRKRVAERRDEEEQSMKRRKIIRAYPTSKRFITLSGQIMGLFETNICLSIDYISEQLQVSEEELALWFACIRNADPGVLTVIGKYLWKRERDDLTVFNRRMLGMNGSGEGEGREELKRVALMRVMCALFSDFPGLAEDDPDYVDLSQSRRWKLVDKTGDWVESLELDDSDAEGA